MIFEQYLQLEKRLNAVLGRGAAPRGISGGGRVDGLGDLGRIGNGDFPKTLAAKSFINTRIFPWVAACRRSKLSCATWRAGPICKPSISRTSRLTMSRRCGAGASLLRLGARPCATGYDARFRRLWTLYLADREAGFAERRIGDLQLLLTKPRWRAAVSQPRLGRATLGPRRVILMKPGYDRAALGTGMRRTWLRWTARLCS